MRTLTTGQTSSPTCKIMLSPKAHLADLVEKDLMTKAMCVFFFLSPRTQTKNRTDIAQSKRYCQLMSNGATTPSPHLLSPLSTPLLNHNRRLRALNLTITQPLPNPLYSRNCTLLLSHLHKISITPTHPLHPQVLQTPIIRFLQSLNNPMQVLV